MTRGRAGSGAKVSVNRCTGVLRPSTYVSGTVS